MSERPNRVPAPVAPSAAPSSDPAGTGAGAPSNAPGPVVERLRAIEMQARECLRAACGAGTADLPGVLARVVERLASVRDDLQASPKLRASRCIHEELRDIDTADGYLLTAAEVVDPDGRTVALSAGVNVVELLDLHALVHGEGVALRSVGRWIVADAEPGIDEADQAAAVEAADGERTDEGAHSAADHELGRRGYGGVAGVLLAPEWL